MNNPTLPEGLNKLKDLPYEVRGVGVKNVLDFILAEEGEEGLRRLEEKMLNLGFTVRHKELKMLQFYHISLYLALCLVIKEVFDYQDEDFVKMGRFMAKSSLIIRLFLKHFVSINNTVTQAPRAWEKYFTVGSLEIDEVGERDRKLTARLRGFDFHPLHNQITKGFLEASIQMIVRDPTRCDIVKSSYKGDDCNEFVVSW